MKVGESKAGIDDRIVKIMCCLEDGYIYFKVVLT